MCRGPTRRGGGAAAPRDATAGEDDYGRGSTDKASTGISQRVELAGHVGDDPHAYVPG